MTETVNVGRPRDDRIDRAVLESTRDLLGELSYADLTMTAVAARAGTSVPAIRRRWPSKAHLVHHAVFPDDVAVPPRRHDTSLRDEAAAVIDSCAMLMSSPAMVRAITGLLSDLAADEDLQRELTARLRQAVWTDLGERFAEAAERDGVHLSVDVDLVVETTFGTALMAALLRGADGLDGRWRAAMTELLLAGVGADRRPTEAAR
ncbi:TetR/AcrR family transcriptional regulator [Gordonia neofelifaecis]|uniref:Putative transcriptional regulator n=1 Tax=Gordonia neofelifaecis NRRL B-59395 TaxID=644548 RepID=F1YJE1_9ACTN|nr:TetR/AcrR family transcriptional regulator [Gordonia neofelifaecis]EGD55174.1 putative transcriptional regulator [Gordonia neofelifaecis NRRL B-59395]